MDKNKTAVPKQKKHYLRAMPLVLVSLALAAGAVGGVVTMFMFSSVPAIVIPAALVTAGFGSILSPIVKSIPDVINDTEEIPKLNTENNAKAPKRPAPKRMTLGQRLTSKFKRAHSPAPHNTQTPHKRPKI